MKKIIVILFLFFFHISISQTKQKSYKFDYTVDYVYYTKKHDSFDTLKLSFNNKGTYFYTNNKMLGGYFGRSILTKEEDLINATMHSIIDLKNGTLIFEYNNGKNKLFKTFNIDRFFPRIENEEFDFSLQKINEKKNLNTYILSESKDDKKPLTITLDESKNFSLQIAFNFIMNQVYGKKVPQLIIPKGLLMNTKNKDGKIVLRAVRINKALKKITTQNNFIIE